MKRIWSWYDMTIKHKLTFNGSKVLSGVPSRHPSFLCPYYLRFFQLRDCKWASKSSLALIVVSLEDMASWLGSREIWEPSCWLKMLSQNDAAHTGHIPMFLTPSLCRWASLFYSISDHAEIDARVGNSILRWGALSTHPVLKVPMWLISSDVVSGALSFPWECSTLQKMPLYRRSMESLQLANEDSASQLAGKIWQEHNSMFYTKLTDRKKGNQPVPKKIG